MRASRHRPATRLAARRVARSRRRQLAAHEHGGDEHDVGVGSNHHASRRGRACRPGRRRAGSASPPPWPRSSASSCAARHRRPSPPAAGRSTPPATAAQQLVDVQEARTAAVEADAIAASSFLVGGAGVGRAPRPPTRPASVRPRSLAHRRRPAGARRRPRRSSAPPTRRSSRYAGLVEQARANNRQGFPVGAAYQRQASALLRSDLLPALDAVDAASRDRLNDSLERRHRATARSPSSCSSSPSPRSAAASWLLWRRTRRHRQRADRRRRRARARSSSSGRSSPWRAPDAPCATPSTPRCAAPTPCRGPAPRPSTPAAPSRSTLINRGNGAANEADWQLADAAVVAALDEACASAGACFEDLWATYEDGPSPRSASSTTAATTTAPSPLALDDGRRRRGVRRRHRPRSAPSRPSGPSDVADRLRRRRASRSSALRWVVLVAGLAAAATVARRLRPAAAGVPMSRASRRAMAAARRWPSPSSSPRAAAPQLAAPADVTAPPTTAADDAGAAGVHGRARPTSTPPAPTRPTVRCPRPATCRPGRRWPRSRTAAGSIVGVSADTLQFGARNPISGQIEGFDIDILKEVATAIFGDVDPPPIEYRVITYAQRLPSLEAGDVDLVAHTMTINCNRWLRIGFSSTYYDAGQKVLVPNGVGHHRASRTSSRPGPGSACRAAAPTSRRSASRSTPASRSSSGRTSPTASSPCSRARPTPTTGDDTVLVGLAAQDPNLEVVGERVHRGAVRRRRQRRAGRPRAASSTACSRTCARTAAGPSSTRRGSARRRRRRRRRSTGGSRDGAGAADRRRPGTTLDRDAAARRRRRARHVGGDDRLAARRPRRRRPGVRQRRPAHRRRRGLRPVAGGVRARRASGTASPTAPSAPPGRRAGRRHGRRSTPPPARPSAPDLADALTFLDALVAPLARRARQQPRSRPRPTATAWIALDADLRHAEQAAARLGQEVRHVADLEADAAAGPAARRRRRPSSSPGPPRPGPASTRAEAERDGAPRPPRRGAGRASPTSTAEEGAVRALAAACREKIVDAPNLAVPSVAALGPPPD